MPEPEWYLDIFRDAITVFRSGYGHDESPSYPCLEERSSNEIGAIQAVRPEAIEEPVLSRVARIGSKHSDATLATPDTNPIPRR